MNNSIIEFLLKFFKKESKNSVIDSVSDETEIVSKFYASVKPAQKDEKNYNNPKILDNNPEFQRIIKNLKKTIKIEANFLQNQQINKFKKDKENAL